MSNTTIISIERIRSAIHVFRGQRVMLDSDLAELYKVLVKDLTRAVRRNIERFPEDFMFQLSDDEHKSLRSKNGTFKPTRGAHRKYAPYVFTEQGVAMLSGVLRSSRAIQVNIEIMRTFVQLRRFALTNEQLRARLGALEKRMDRGFKAVFEAIQKLLEDDEQKPTRGFAR